MRKLVLASLLLLFTAHAHGQTSTVTVGQPFTLAWDQPAPGAGQSVQTGYRIELNGSQVGTDITDPAARQTTMAAIANCGQNSVRVASLAPGAQPAWSAALTFGVTNCPSPGPTNLRIIITLVRNEDGTYRPVLTLENIPPT